MRYAGEDLKVGTAVLGSGKLLKPADVGLIASLGIGEVRVRRRLRVAFFATGDELASIGQPLKEGEVYDSNRYTVHGMLARLGVEAIDMGVVRDDPAALEKAFLVASKHDVVITTGGVSVGEADFIKQMMAKLGEVLFWKIAMRPGRPMAFGKIGDAFLFGLPGNPVAVMVTFYQFVRDALLHMSGREDAPIPLLQAVSAENLRKVPGRTEYQRGILFKEQGEWKVRTTGQQGSGVLRSMSEANCFIVLEHERGTVKAGEPVSVQLFEGLGLAAARGADEFQRSAEDVEVLLVVGGIGAVDLDPLAGARQSFRLERHYVVPGELRLGGGGRRQPQADAVAADAGEHAVVDEISVQAVDLFRAHARQLEQHGVDLRLAVRCGGH